LRNQVGFEEIRCATSAVVVGHRSPGGSTTLGGDRARAVRTELRRINPNLEVTVVDAGTRSAGRSDCVRNQCAIVELRGLANSSDAVATFVDPARNLKNKKTNLVISRR
jgi:hypothetical protein